MKNSPVRRVSPVLMTKQHTTLIRMPFASSLKSSFLNARPSRERVICMISTIMRIVPASGWSKPTVNPRMSPIRTQNFTSVTMFRRVIMRS